MFILLINNHTVFLIQFEVDLKLIFQKAEIVLTEVAYAISVFFKKNSLIVQINSKLNLKSYDFLY